jgi:hypothetical protein
MQDTTTDAVEANGSAPLSARESIAAQLDALLVDTRHRRDAMQAQVAELTAEIKSYEQSARALRGEVGKPGRKPGSKPPGKPYGKSVGDERLAEIERAVRAFAADHEEFRQIDIRAQLDIGSSVAATAFETLRQNNVIRLARKQGNNKYFRLTTEALQGQEPATSEHENA